MQNHVLYKILHYLFQKKNCFITKTTNYETKTN